MDLDTRCQSKILVTLTSSLNLNKIYLTYKISLVNNICNTASHRSDDFNSPYALLLGSIQKDDLKYNTCWTQARLSRLQKCGSDIRCLYPNDGRTCGAHTKSIPSSYGCILSLFLHKSILTIEKILEKRNPSS